MKRCTYIFILACIAFTAFSQTQVIAHRGYWDTEYSAQNSITSFYKAAQAGCYGSEFDVQMTSDDTLIVFHDAELQGKKIAETPYDSLRNYHLRNGEILPTLEQFLIHARNFPQVKLILEIKTNSNITSESIVKLVHAITTQIDYFQLQTRTEYIAFNLNVCKEVIKVKPDAFVYYLGGNLSPIQLKELGLSGADYYFSQFTENPDLVKQLHQLGLKVNAWTVNDADIMKKLMDIGVDFITTDKPLLLKKN